MRSVFRLTEENAKNAGAIKAGAWPEDWNHIFHTPGDAHIQYVWVSV
jgi:hypothetical protein